MRSLGLFLAILATASTTIAHTQGSKRSLIKQTGKVKKFAVDGEALPEVDFDIGESYAGLLPISDEQDAPELFFWFVPTENDAGKNEVTIWLNGGPGCSSLNGFLEENGPIYWGPGRVKPRKSQYAWSNLTNMIWVEQPAGTGFSKQNGGAYVHTEKAVAQHFLGFFKNFIDTFSLQGKKIYITGESYAGLYVPYIAHAMLDSGDKTHFDLEGSMLVDPVMDWSKSAFEAVIVPFGEYWKHVLGITPKRMEELHKKHVNCGYAAYLEKYLSFPPPKGSFPPLKVTCGLSYGLQVSINNPCFNSYYILDQCPSPYDALIDGTPYFSREDVQKVINAPVGAKWQECGGSELQSDRSPPAPWTVLPKVIERSKRTMIVHGNADILVIANQTLFDIQNMTWGGDQGFQSRPEGRFRVPHPHGDFQQQRVAWVQGVTHTERKLTWVETFLAGHMLPMYQPAAAYRQLQYLLGRIDDLTKTKFGNDDEEDLW